jgi:hypothetical protein
MTYVAKIRHCRGFAKGSIGKSGTFAIEQDNSNTRHHLGRFTRRTKVVSKSKEMVEDLTTRLWSSLTKPEIFAAWQEKLSYIYK